MVDKIDVMIFMYERFRLFEETLYSLKTASDFPMRIIVIDNGSSDPTKKLLEELLKAEEIQEIVHTRTDDFWMARYVGRKQVTTEIFGMVDADYIFPAMMPCFITRMLAIMDEYPEIPVLGTERACGFQYIHGAREYYKNDLRLIKAPVEGNFVLYRNKPDIPLRDGDGSHVLVEDIVSTHLSWSMWKDPENHDYMRSSMNLRGIVNRAGAYETQLRKYYEIKGKP